MHFKTLAPIAIAAALAFAGPVMAAGDPALVQPQALTWVPAAGLPEGALMAVLYGDPSKEGPFTLRFKFPPGYEIATHSHPTDEFVTVISGEGRMAFGEEAKVDAAEPMMAGSFMSLPAGAWHHLSIETETVIELQSTGPFGTHLH